MYCGQCGKKVMENMLFCPFCGSPIVIPEQDEPEQSAAVIIEEPEQPVQEERQVSLFDGLEEEPAEEERVEEAQEEAFVPLVFSFDEPEAEEAAELPAEEAPEQPEEEDAEDEEMLFLAEEPEPEPEPEPKPVRKEPKAAPRMERKRAAKTYIPMKDVDPDNLFMDEQADADEDEYDLPGEDEPAFEEEFDFEEPEEGGFFQRHIRGIVGLLLMMVVVLILLIWACSPKGQNVLARVNLAWDPEVYADLGYESYQQNSDLLAARYYEKALARDPENYDYAHSAMVAYYEADKIESAATMLKKCVEMRPDSAQPYQEMLILYPDPAKRPWEITELVRMGYARTGDPSLKID